MKESLKKAKRELVGRAQAELDRHVGPRVVAKMLGVALDDVGKRRIHNLALKELHKAGFDTCTIEVVVRGALVELKAHGPRR